MAHDAPAEGSRERLVAEAHAQRGHARLGEAAHHLDADARLVGRPRPGRDEDAVPVAGEQVVYPGRVVADGDHLGPQLGHASWRAASSMARTTPRALERDSSYS